MAAALRAGVQGAWGGVSLKWSRGLLQEGGLELALEGGRGFTETGSSVGSVGGARNMRGIPLPLNVECVWIPGGSIRNGEFYYIK